MEVDGQKQEFALIESNIRIGIFADPAAPATRLELPFEGAEPLGGFTNQDTVTIDGEEFPVYLVPVDGVTRELALVGQTALGRFVDPTNPSLDGAAKRTSQRAGGRTHGAAAELPGGHRAAKHGAQPEQHHPGDRRRSFWAR